jgi:hypothetical protein
MNKEVEDIVKEYSGWNADEIRMVMASDFLLRKYVKYGKRIVGSPYEALVFGKIFRLQQCKYGYCSLSKEKLAWELGTSYKTILRAIKNLLKDGYIKEVEHALEDDFIETTCYVAILDNLKKDITIWKKN